MQATSIAQFEASKAGTVPPLESVRDDVWSLPLPMPGGHIPYSLQYLLRDSDGAMHVIDPGWDSDDNWQTLIDALATVGAAVEDVRSITATHLHPDHIGMAARLQAASGGRMQLHVIEREALGGFQAERRSAWTAGGALSDWGVPRERLEEIERVAKNSPQPSTIRVDRVLTDGERLDIPGFDLVAMLTAGHTSGHLSLRDDTRSLMYTGDHVLPTMHAGLGLGGSSRSNALADYLSALEKVSEYPEYEVLPGHGYRFLGLAERAARSSAHHLRRAREVAAVLEEDPRSSLWAIASRLTWTAGWGNLTGFYLYSALSQTLIHRNFVESDGLARFTA